MNPPALPLATESPEMQAKLQFQREFFARMGPMQQFRSLFDHLPEVHFFAKDRAGRFVTCSLGLLKRLGFEHESQIVGITDFDVHPPRTAREIREDDERVMSSRIPLVDRVEALFTRSQAKDWYVATKLPLVDAANEVIGVMGFVRPYRKDVHPQAGDKRLSRVVAHIRKNHSQPLRISSLAKLANVSVRQLHRLFHEVFGMSTEKFVARTRVQAASDALLMTDLPISDIALNHGFCDQSAFSRRFAEHTGETPLKFRQRRKRTHQHND
jgi:AraC-like DNA-binding protein